MKQVVHTPFNTSLNHVLDSRDGPFGHHPPEGPLHILSHPFLLLGEQSLLGGRGSCESFHENCVVGIDAIGQEICTSMRMPPYFKFLCPGSRQKVLG